MWFLWFLLVLDAAAAALCRAVRYLEDGSERGGFRDGQVQPSVEVLHDGPLAQPG